MGLIGWVKENKVKTYNYPIRNGLLVGDVMILIVASCGFGAAVAIGSFMPLLDLLITMFIFGIFFLIAVLNFYVCTYKTLRDYENEHGSTKKGDKFK